MIMVNLIKTVVLYFHCHRGSLVTSWKRDKEGNIVQDEQSGKPVLMFVAIQRQDTKGMKVLTIPFLCCQN